MVRTQIVDGNKKESGKQCARPRTPMKVVKKRATKRPLKNPKVISVGSIRKENYHDPDASPTISLPDFDKDVEFLHMRKKGVVI